MRKTYIFWKFLELERLDIYEGTLVRDYEVGVLHNTHGHMYTRTDPNTWEIQTQRRSRPIRAAALQSGGTRR